jgi:hypothetical protein
VLPGRVIREFIENDGIVGGIIEASAEHAEASVGSSYKRRRFAPMDR